jgi:hypothetical protein
MRASRIVLTDTGGDATRRYARSREFDIFGADPPRAAHQPPPDRASWY